MANITESDYTIARGTTWLSPRSAPSPTRQRGGTDTLDPVVIDLTDHGSGEDAGGIAPAVTTSVIIPTLNEAANIVHVLPALPAWITEVILVDGGSTDGTVDAALLGITLALMAFTNDILINPPDIIADTAAEVRDLVNDRAAEGTAPLSDPAPKNPDRVPAAD